MLNIHSRSLCAIQSSLRNDILLQHEQILNFQTRFSFHHIPSKTWLAPDWTGRPKTPNKRGYSFAFTGIKYSYSCLITLLQLLAPESLFLVLAVLSVAFTVIASLPGRFFREKTSDKISTNVLFGVTCSQNNQKRNDRKLLTFSWM